MTITTGTTIAGDTRSEFVVDLARMRRERLVKLQDGMRREGLDALVLGDTSAVRYATGVEMLNTEWARTEYEPSIAVVLPDGPPHLFTPYPEGAPPELPDDHVHPALLVEFDDGIGALAGALSDLVGTGESKVGFDLLSAAALERLPELLPKTTIADAGAVLGPAKIIKTDDELELIRRAQRINELAMYDVYEALRPGVRQTELSGVFLRRIFELGANGNVVDPIWQVMPRSIAEGPFTTHGDVAFPTVSNDQILRQDDVMFVDTGILYEGYSSDFGRTWIVGGKPSAKQIDQFKRWKDVMHRILELVRPGVTGRELGRAAREPGVERAPWLDHFWFIHGIGTESSEMPLLGTHLGDEFDETIVLTPGMTMVLEPVIWEDGEGGYRSEDIVAVTETGYRTLSAFSYMPYEEGTFVW